VATELPASSVLRLFVTAVGSSDFCGEGIADVLAAFATFVFCDLSLAWAGFFPASEESESELSSESESESDVELESSADVEDPEDSESLPLMEGRVWLDPAGDRDLGASEAGAPSALITTAFGVETSSSESEESESELDESADIIVSEGTKIREKHPPPDSDLAVVAAVFLALVVFGVGTGTLLFTSLSSESDDSESELELESPSDLEAGGEDFDVGVLTLDLTPAFGLGEREFFGEEETTFAPESFLFLDFREPVSESASKNERVPLRRGRTPHRPDSELDSFELESESSEAALGVRM